MLARLEIYGIVALGLLLTFIGAEFHGRSVGREQTRAEDAVAALAQRAQWERDKAADDKRQRDAFDALQAELVVLSRPQPATHLVCHAAPSQPVPATGPLSPAHPPGAGALPQGGAQDFDPGPALDALHDEADRIVAECRQLNDSVPH